MHANSITCTRRIQFCAGHRVMEHESKCRHLHGHNYIAHLTARQSSRKGEAGAKLDMQGRVVDFSVLKYQIGEWIMRHWDHGFILHKDDIAGQHAMGRFTSEEVDRTSSPAFQQKLFLLPYNPTAENLARYLLEVVQHSDEVDLPNVELVKVVIEETENCSAEARHG